MTFLTSMEDIFMIEYHMGTCDTAFESLKYVFSNKNILVNGGSTPVDFLLYLCISEPLFSCISLQLTNIQHLGNTCWLNVDQNFVIEKYDISAFKCRVSHPHSTFIHEFMISWVFTTIMHILKWSIFLSNFWKVKNSQILIFRQHLWTPCVRYEYNDHLTSKGSISSPFSSNIMV